MDFRPLGTIFLIPIFTVVFSSEQDGDETQVGLSDAKMMFNKDERMRDASLQQTVRFHFWSVHNLFCLDASKEFMTIKLSWNFIDIEVLIVMSITKLIL